MTASAPLQTETPQKTRSVARPRPVSLSVASAEDRAFIYRTRHAVYARELRQHPVNRSATLRDRLDDSNVYLVARCGGDIAGFVSITPPAAGSYSIDKYLPRAALPFPTMDGVHEIRLLTVLGSRRGSELAALLGFAALRWVESRGGGHVMAIGRREILDMYLKAGLQRTGRVIRAGAVVYELLHATVAALRERMDARPNLLRRLAGHAEWKLDFPLAKPAACFHGGGFFSAIGEKFDALDRREDVINADVLDAWFPPSPGVLDALTNHLPWLLRTSPPTDCAGLIAAISEARNTPPGRILPGAGSSDLIFRGLRHWLTPKSRVLILDPTYGEYAHVLEKVIGCTVERFALSRADEYVVDPDRLAAAIARGFDLVILVNPNSPTGRHIPRSTMETLLREAPAATRFWIDETYVDFAGPDESLEPFAAGSENVIVCKSMSKAYALSGARVAYLCASPHQLEELRAITPPWVVGLPAQVAAVEALRDPDYYRARHRETHDLRATLAGELKRLGWKVIPGVANFLLCHLPDDGPDAAAIIRECQRRQLFLRDAAAMGSAMGNRALRIAVKDRGTNARMVRIVREALAVPCPSGPACLG